MLVISSFLRNKKNLSHKIIKLKIKSLSAMVSSFIMFKIKKKEVVNNENNDKSTYER